MDRNYYFPARILQRSGEMPETIEHTLRDLIKADLQGVAPYFFRAEISSDRLDSHYTHMLDSTLENFATESESGVSFLDSHKRWSLPIGYTLTGSKETSNGVTRVVADLYTIPGINLGSHSYASTDDLIRALKGALVRDVSVGFYGGAMICDICGGDFHDWRSCRHWPGRKYTINNDNGDNGDGEEVVATFGIGGAHLAEVSGVYAGSTPEAAIQRAEGMAEAGLLDGDEIRRLETQYRIKIPTGQRIWAVEEKIQEKGKLPMDEIEQIKEILDKAQIPIGEPIARVQRLVDAIDRLKDENARLAPLADQGREYREDMIKQALDEGVRAQGKEFPTEIYEKMMENADIAHIKQMRDDWGRLAAEKFTGNRLTVDDEQQPPAPAPASSVPNAAYKS